MERYRLSWIPSTSSNASTQNVVAILNAGPETILASGLLMTTGSIEHDFETNTDVIWTVVTYNSNLSQSVESAADEFLAENLEALSPATSLSHEWILHT